MSRKIVILGVIAAFAPLAFAAPAFAADTVKARGTVVYSTVEKPHYELVVRQYSYDPAYLKPGSYVLQGPFDFKRYLGRCVEVEGKLYTGPSIWMKPVIYVTRITPLDAVFVPVAKWRRSRIPFPTLR